MIASVAEAQSWLAAHRLTQTQYLALAMPLCLTQETDPNGRLSKIKRQNADNLATLRLQIASAQALVSALDTNLAASRAALTTYADSLAAVIGAEIVRNHISQLIDQDKAAEAEKYFNTEIKTEQQNFTDFYLEHVDNCDVLSQRQVEQFNRIDTKLLVLGGSFQNSIDRTRPEVTEILRIANDIKHRMKSRVDRCFTNMADGGVIPPPLYGVP